MKVVTRSIAVILLLILLGCSGARSESIKSQAERIHREAIVIDGYIGTTSQIMWDDWDFTEKHSVEESHVDLPRMSEGGLDAAIFSVGAMDSVTGAAAVQVSLEEIERLHRLAELHPDELAFCRSAGEMRRAHREGKKALLLF